MNSNNNLPKLNNDTTSETSIFKKVSSINDKNATSSTLNDNTSDWVYSEMEESTRFASSDIKEINAAINK